MSLLKYSDMFDCSICGPKHLFLLLLLLHTTLTEFQFLQMHYDQTASKIIYNQCIMDYAIAQ